jgi:PhzF family phenazine biosynthesis protein
MFCPSIGIPEDPVSGNAHGLLGAYLLHHGLLDREGDRARFSGAQGQFQHRPGRVDVELEFDGDVLAGVWIIGSATMVFETTIALP